MRVCLGDCTITSMAKILHSKIFQKTLILAFEASSALSYQNDFFPCFRAFCALWSKFQNDNKYATIIQSEI